MDQRIHADSDAEVANAPCRVEIDVARSRTLGHMKADLQTLAEKTGFTQTGRTNEVSALCEKFARAWPEAVRCIQYGTSVEGRPMLALLASRCGALDAKTLKAHNVPLLMIQAGIHP